MLIFIRLPFQFEPRCDLRGRPLLPDAASWRRQRVQRARHGGHDASELEPFERKFWYISRREVVQPAVGLVGGHWWGDRGALPLLLSMLEYRR